MSIDLEAPYQGDLTGAEEAGLRELLRAADYALWVAARAKDPIAARWARFQAERLIALARDYFVT